MKILHFAESFSQPTETFIKRYVQKSMQFAEVAVAAYRLQNIDDDIKEKVTLFELSDWLYSRKTLPGAIRFIYEHLTGTRLWYKQLNGVIEAFKPDVIHCHFGNSGIAIMNFNKNFNKNIPYVTTFYGYDISSLPATDKKYRSNLIKLWNSGSAFFAEGPELAKKGVALGCPSSKWLINPLLIPVEDYPIKEKYRNAGDPIKFLFVGRFIEKKGFHLFLAAIAQLKEKIKDFSIDIVGAGPYREEYEHIISEYKLEPFVTWLGMLKHNEIIATMKDYDFLVHPSLTAKDNDSEGGAPTILIEAQAVGLPIITSNHADIPYVMGYHEFMSNEGDISSLAVQTENMINLKSIENYIKMGRAKVLAQHSLNGSDIYENNLKKIISKN
jgi:colanic acid/amylovoran biosynthesis glycosyltransferase